MSTNFYNNEEQRSYLYHRDGLADIFLGLGILAFGLLLLTKLFWMIGILAAVFVPIWQSAKQGITAPRLSNVKYHPEKTTSFQDRMRLAVGFGIGSLTLGAIAIWLFSTRGLSSGLFVWLGAHVAEPLAILAGVLISLIGLLFRIHRFYVYALLTVAFTYVGDFLIPPVIYVSALGILVLLVGIIHLISFLSEYPREQF